MTFRLDDNFFMRDALSVAPELPGKYVAFMQNGRISLYLITEVEAYRGEEDIACHASKGRTRRTEIMYHSGGHIYVYLVYGMYWMLNFVTGKKDEPQAVLIRGLEDLNGPGKLTRHLKIDRSYYGENLCISNRIWVEDKGYKPIIKTSPRIGIDYAGEPWVSKLWRYSIDG
jgi:DNA-3-methyladenine glycosylase